jgi:hypothetical protein
LPEAFAAAVLGQHPAGDTAVLLLSELVTNSVRHSASGLPGSTVTVTVLAAGEVIRVEVADRSGVTVPALRPGGSGLEGGGRGLYLVDCLAARGIRAGGRSSATSRAWGRRTLTAWAALRQAAREGRSRRKGVRAVEANIPVDC